MNSADASTRPEDAQALLAWMRSLDTSVPEREELLTVGVAANTVEALYPRDFNAIVPGLCKHLRTYGVRGLRGGGKEESLYTLLSSLRIVRGSLTSDLQERYLLDFGEQLSDSSYKALIREVQDQFVAASLEKQDHGSATFTASGLWYCWWFLNYFESLNPGQRGAVEEVAQWLRVHLLQLP
jgi:hypothetical protein